MASARVLPEGAENRGAVGEQLAALETALAGVRRLLAEEDWAGLEAWLDACRKSRGEILS